MLRSALAPAPGRRMLSIASAGDNAFALLAAGAEVVAADLSPAQLALVELKRAAIRRLGHEEVLAFLGIQRGAEDRRSVYERLERDLPASARDFFRERLDAVAGGVIHDGKFEGYFRLFRERVLPLIHRRKTVVALLDEKDEEARKAFYRRTWNNLRWRLLFRVFFSRFAMGRLGRDPEFFRYVEGSVAERILGADGVRPDRAPRLRQSLHGVHPHRQLPAGPPPVPPPRGLPRAEAESRQAHPVRGADRGGRARAPGGGVRRLQSLGPLRVPGRADERRRLRQAAGDGPCRRPLRLLEHAGAPAPRRRLPRTGPPAGRRGPGAVRPRPRLLLQRLRPGGGPSDLSGRPPRGGDPLRRSSSSCW